MRATFDMKTKEWTISPLDGWQSAKELCRRCTYLSHLITTNKIVVLNPQKPFDRSHLIRWAGIELKAPELATVINIKGIW